MTYSIDRVAEMAGAVRYGSLQSEISWLLTDSRSLCFPTETLFFALVTKTGDGHDYLNDLHQRGVKNFVIEKLPENIGDYSDSNLLLVKNSLTALQNIAASHRRNFNIPVVGVTGSNGKTVIKEWLYQLLEPDYTVTRSPRSYNSQIGVPLSVWLLNTQSQIGVFEAGISQKDEMPNLWKIIKPTIGVLSNIGLAHQENFPSVQDKCIEKLQLFKDCDVIIYDGDNEGIQDCVNKTVITAREIAWSRRNPEKPLFISAVKKGTSSTRIEYRYIGFDSWFEIPFIDDASIENAIHCLAVCVYMIVPPEKIRERMATLEPVAMRLEVKDGKHGCVIINDSYSSDLSSLAIALDFMSRRQDEKTRGRTLILSDILQSGWQVNELYRVVAQYVESNGITKLIGIGKDISSARKKFNVPQKYFFNTTKEFLKSREIEEIRNELVLVKGARAYNFDWITERLELKVHETILEVNLGAIASNLDRYRNMLRPETRIVCMVKASAYGGGAVEVAKTLQDRRVNYLAVAVADEGWELRKAGITTNIMVMNPERTSFNTLFEQSLEPEIYSFHLLDMFVRAAEHNGITNFPIHIKIDTGMHRLGFAPSDIPELIQRLKRQTAVIPRSVFSHFVGSDSEDFNDFTKVQLDRFVQASTMLQEAFPHRILRHICNSAAIESDINRCNQLAELVDSKVMIINGDGRDPSLLLSEGINHTEAFIALTDSSETNILACLAAKRFGVTKTIAEVENIDYINMADKLDIGTVINKKKIAASHIYQMMLDADVSNVKCLTFANADVAEFNVKPSARITRECVKDIRLPKGVTIGGLIRNNEAILVTGNTQIQENDHVVVFCLEGMIKSIEKFFN